MDRRSRWSRPIGWRLRWVSCPAVSFAFWTWSTRNGTASSSRTAGSRSSADGTTPRIASPTAVSRSGSDVWAHWSALRTWGTRSGSSRAESTGDMTPAAATERAVPNPASGCCRPPASRHQLAGDRPLLVAAIPCRRGSIFGSGPALGRRIARRLLHGRNVRARHGCDSRDQGRDRRVPPLQNGACRRQERRGLVACEIGGGGKTHLGRRGCRKRL